MKGTSTSLIRNSVVAALILAVAEGVDPGVLGTPEFPKLCNYVLSICFLINFLEIYIDCLFFFKFMLIVELLFK
jgi:hypothetical protein